MTCNFLNEGCDGGQPIFNALFAENNYLVSEMCAPYEHKTKGKQCSNYEKCKPIAKVKNTKVVGDGYA